MNKLTLQSIALVLLIAAFPLISYGTVGGDSTLWWLGLIALCVGGLLPVATRFLNRGDTGKKARDCGMEYDERVS